MILSQGWGQSFEDGIIVVLLGRACAHRSGIACAGARAPDSRMVCVCVVPHVCVCYQGGCKSLGTQGALGGGLILCRWGLLWAFAVCGDDQRQRHVRFFHFLDYYALPLPLLLRNSKVKTEKDYFPLYG